MTNAKPELAPIPTAVRAIYQELEEELVWIHGRWIMYRQLFGTNAKRVELLNESAPLFFSQMQFLWFDYVVLEICKLTDAPSINGHQNLVITQLHRRLNRTQNAEICDRLSTLGDVVRDKCQPLRDRRNQHVAHNDLNAALGQNDTPIAGVSRDAVEQALASLRNYLNAFRLHFIGGEMCFEGFSMRDDGSSLIYALKQAAVFRDMERDDWQLSMRLSDGKWKDA